MCVCARAIPRAADVITGNAPPRVIKSVAKPAAIRVRDISTQQNEIRSSGERFNELILTRFTEARLSQSKSKEREFLSPSRCFSSFPGKIRNLFRVEKFTGEASCFPWH